MQKTCVWYTRQYLFFTFLTFFFSGCGPFFKSLLNFLKYNTVYFLCFGFFARKACGILVPWPGIEPESPALQGRLLTPGSPGKSLYLLLNFISSLSYLCLQIPSFKVTQLVVLFWNCQVGFDFPWHAIFPYFQELPTSLRRIL